jgi:hypothetical protein
MKKIHGSSLLGKKVWMLNETHLEVVSENTKSITLSDGKKLPRTKVNFQHNSDTLVEIGEWV